MEQNQDKYNIKGFAMDYFILASLGGALNAYFVIALAAIVLGFMLAVVQRVWVFDPTESVVAREHEQAHDARARAMQIARTREHNNMLLTLMAAQAGIDPVMLRVSATISQPTPGTRIDVGGWVSDATSFSFPTSTTPTR